MNAADRLAAATARMDRDQLWALRVAVATERRLRTHFQADEQTREGPMSLAHRWALENVI